MSQEAKADARKAKLAMEYGEIRKLITESKRSHYHQQSRRLVMWPFVRIRGV